MYMTMRHRLPRRRPIINPNVIVRWLVCTIKLGLGQLKQLLQTLLFSVGNIEVRANVALGDDQAMTGCYGIAIADENGIGIVSNDELMLRVLRDSTKGAVASFRRWGVGQLHSQPTSPIEPTRDKW